MGRILSEYPMMESPSILNFYNNRDRYFLLLPLQRNYVWSESRASELIVSIIKGFPFGNLTASFNDKTQKYDILDGVQRSTTIFKYLTGEYSISKDAENITINDKEYEIAGKTYDQLDKDIKNIFAIRQVNIQVYRGLTDAECDEIILRLNMGVQLSTIEFARLLDKDIQSFVSYVASLELFDRKVDITVKNKEKYVHESLIYSLIALETKLDDVALYNPIRIIEKLKNNSLTKEIKTTIVEVVEYMNNIFPMKHKLLCQQNFLSTYYACKALINDKEIDDRMLFKILNDFYGGKNEHYYMFRETKSNQTIENVKEKTDIMLSYINTQIGVNMKI